MEAKRGEKIQTGSEQSFDSSLGVIGILKNHFVDF